MQRRSLFGRLCIIVTWIGLIFGTLFVANRNYSAPTNPKVLNIFSWSNVLPDQVIKEFEQKTGIRVHVDYYSSNEELLIKLKNIKDSGYDLIIPSDYAVKMLIDDKLVKPLNKQNLTFLEDIHPLLTGHEFDPANTYSLPLQWDLYGFGIDKDEFTTPAEIPNSWDHLFKDELIHYKIAMTNDPVEAFCIGSMYLFGEKDHLTPKELQLVKKLLIDQKKHVESYAIPRSDYVLGSKNAAVALTLSAYILRSQEDFAFIEFSTPKEKTFISIENIAVPANASHEDNAYAFLNFLYKEENMAAACNSFGVFPATKSAIPLLKNQEALYKVQQEIAQESYKLLFFKHLCPERDLRLIWAEVKH